MNELNQILNSEEKGKEIIEQAERRASSEIEKKKGEFARKLQKESELSVEEKQKIIDEKEESIRTIEKEFNQNLEQKLKRIREKKAQRMDQAVKNIIKLSFSD